MRNSINKFNKALDQVENSINAIKKVKISETEPYSFINEFPAISLFYIENITITITITITINITILYRKYD